MSGDAISHAAVSAVLFIAIPWCIFVTLSIFNLKEQVALLKQEIALLRELQEVLKEIKLGMIK